MRAVAQASKDAVRRTHKRLTTVSLWTPDGFVADLPFSDGSVEFSLSRADGVRSGRVVVPGYDWYAMAEPGRRTWVEVDVEIEGQVWSFGSFPVLRATANRPRGTVELALGDWAHRRSQPGVEISWTVGSTAQTVKACVEAFMRDTSPDALFTVTRDDSGGAAVRSPQELSLGGNVWSALTAIANQVGCVIVVTGRHTGEIRRFEAGAEQDSADGTIVAETTAVLADEAVNRVIVQGEMSGPGGTATVFRADRTLTTGPYAYDREGFGGWALVSTFRQPVVTQAAVDAEAERIFERRAGIVRSTQAETVPTPWWEVGDTIGWESSFTGGRLVGLIDSMTFPLTARGTQRITLRDGVIR